MDKNNQSAAIFLIDEKMNNDDALKKILEQLSKMPTKNDIDDLKKEVMDQVGRIAEISIREQVGKMYGQNFCKNFKTQSLNGLINLTKSKSEEDRTNEIVKYADEIQKYIFVRKIF